VPLEVLRDTIQPFPTFSELYVGALHALHAAVRESEKPSHAT
jgi:dihydrolipoamide dehydrogenase